MLVTGSVAWKKLIGSHRYFATQFTASATYTPTIGGLWLRRIGTPSADLSVAIYSNNATPTPDVPNAIVGSAGAQTTSVDDIVSFFVPVAITPGELTSGTLYWLVVYAGADVEGAHWEVGFDNTTGTSAYATAGLTWTAETATIYHRIADAATNRSFKFFWLDGAFYCVDRKKGGAVSTVWINGDRGKVVSSTSTVITDTSPGCLGSNWTADMWIGAKIRIIDGTGEGQVRTISDNTTTTITVDTAFDLTPDSTSHYIVYQTHIWQLLVSSWSSKVCRDVCVYDKIALFTMGGSTNSQQMRWNTTDITHNFREDSDADSRGDYVATVYDTADEKIYIYVADNTANNLRRSATAAWGNLDFGNAVTVGDSSYRFTELAEYDNKLYIFKEDSLWTLSGKKPTKVPIGLDTMPSTRNGQAWAFQDLFLYFNWSFSIEQLYGSTLADIGPWHGEGLPSGHSGYFSALTPGVGVLFAAHDAGTAGRSAIYAWNKIGWHEVFRAWSTGASIHSLYWQGNDDGNPYLWWDIGGDLMYMVFPKDTLNPLNDSSVRFQHEGVLVQSYIDLGTAQLPKLYSTVTAHMKNATVSGTEIRIDYQLDQDVGTTTWYEAGTIFTVPFGGLSLGVGNKRNIRVRYRLLTTSSSTPLEARALVVEGFARSPVKYQYNLRIKVSDLAVNFSGLPDIPPDTLLSWLRRESQSAGALRMHSIFAQLDDKLVIAEPPTILRTFANKLLHWWGGVIVITLRDV